MRDVGADTIVTGARVVTMDPRRPAATAFAIRDGRFIAVGSDDIVRELRTARTEVLDLHGATVTPGLIDAHLHPLQGIALTAGADLGGITTIERLREVLRAEADRAIADDADPWVRAWNLDYDVFHDVPMTSAAIEDAVRGLPALVILYDGHTALASAAALTRAGIDRARDFDDSSCIVVDAAGSPTGELRELPAYEPVRKAAPALSREAELAAAHDLLRGLTGSGLTGGAIMDGGFDTLALLDELESGPGLPVRIVSAIDHEPGFDADRTAENLRMRDRRGGRWRGGVVKLYADGVVETGTAWLHELDIDGGGGEPFWKNAAAYARTVREYADAGFQVATHAIGDRAVSEVVDAYLAAGARSANGAPHRIEHLELTTDRDVRRIAAAGITASVQPLHLQWRKADGSDEWSRRLGPERVARAWRAGDFWAAGAPVALGSDWPIAQNDARIGLAWAMLRRRPGQPDAPVFEPEQRLTAYQALHGYTVGAARAQGDGDLGRIAPGCRADYVVWEENPLHIAPDDLPDAPILRTVVGGIPA
ncbi:amidohydrolase [Microbacterium esteraromaticum]|uniref:amidohydrolase n=1 Tax=Microbacterium esteraromaticum TaxID=57043 RepID=UPI001957E8DA|nr:amidohydrolase [Microbacterium esteraromaticum]MBM7465820.1 putative amidohydrolase YtcJ [Microbacterium esteraromaticum]